METKNENKIRSRNRYRKPARPKYYRRTNRIVKRTIGADAMKTLSLILLLSGCATMQDNTTLGDKIIIGSSLLVFGLFAQGASN